MTLDPLIATAFSFLHGASHAEEITQTAKSLGLDAIGIADRNTLAGIVRAHQAAKDANLPFIPGARLVFRDGTPDIAADPMHRAGYAHLCRLLTLGKPRAVKGDCHLDLTDLLTHADGLALLVTPTPGSRLDTTLATLAEHKPHDVWLAATRLYTATDAATLEATAARTRRHKIPLLATTDALYHAPDRRPLHDVMTASASAPPSTAPASLWPPTPSATSNPPPNSPACSATIPKPSPTARISAPDAASASMSSPTNTPTNPSPPAPHPTPISPPSPGKVPPGATQPASPRRSAPRWRRSWP